MNEYSLPLSAAGAARVNDNPYARSVDEIAQEAERRRQREAVTRATDNPDQAAEARRIARQSGVPAPLVQSKLPDYRADQRRAEVAQAARDPRVGPWLAQNAEVAGDDISTLINLGQTGERFMLAKDGARTRFTFSRRELIDENFRPQELTKPQRDIIRAASRSRAEYRSLVSDAVMAKRAPAAAAEMDRQDIQQRQQRGIIGQAVGSLQAGGNSLLGGIVGTGAMVSGLAGFSNAEAGLLDVQRRFEAAAGATRARSDSFIADSLYSGLESVPAASVGLLTGSSKMALGLFFAQTSGNSYAEARGHGLGVLRSTLYGTTQGGIEVATESLPAKALGDIARGNGAISGALKRFFLGDVLGEQAATFLQDANSWVTLNPDKTLSEFIAERPEAAARTFFATLSGSGAQAAVAYGLHRAFRTEREIVESEGQLSQLDALMRAAAESKTRGRDPEAFRDLIEQVAGDGRLMVPGEVIAQFNQSYRDDDFWRDYADEIDEAVATGGEVSIPLADAAARLAGTPDWDAVGPSARIGAEGMSRTEIDEANAAIGTLDREAADEVEAQIRADNRAAAPGVKLRENIRAQLMNAGMTPDVASSNAEIVAALFETEAANLGRKITGDEFGQAISVQRELPGLIGQSQPLDQLDIVVNAMRAGGDVEVGVGPSLLQFIAAQGGINDTGGDLKSMGLPKRMIRDFDPSQSAMLGLSGAGEYGIDNVYRAAISAGYFPDLAQVDEAAGVDMLDTNDFLAAISDELAGRKRFSQVREETYRRAGQELRAILDAAGVDAETASIEEIRAAVALFEEGQTFDQGEQAPNAQIQFTDALAIIKLFETANLTSFQHEMAHFWLERFKGNALAAIDTDGNPAARSTFADWETLKAWFAENGHAVGPDNVIPTEAHELFARSWERYLMEGKAPKTSLNSVFRKVANWFKSIYRSVKALNAPITPEIREVMDRMLATEEEIAAAAQDRAMMLMFDDAVAAGMTEAEAMRYRALGDEARNEAEEELYSKVMRSIRARETKAWKAQERAIRMDVQDMVENQPVFQALGMLRGEYRLDRGWLVDTYGEDALKLLPAGVPPIYRDGGDNADQIAEMVGFKSGDEMVRELMGLERLRQQMKVSGDKRSVKKATIDQEVAEEMHRRYGDPLTDGSIEREAAAAIQNERQGERIEMELRALGSKANRKPTPYALAREWAKGRIARGVVAETVSGDAQYRYTRTATKAAKAATAAFIKGDTAEAFKQKQIEMLHNALAREAAEQGDRIERAVKRMGKLAKQRTVKTLAQDYLDQIHGLLENYEFKQVSQREINARDSYAAWAAEQAAAGKDVVAVERLAQAKNWSRMTVEELIALDDAVKGLVHLGKLKQTLLDNKARRDLDAVVAEALSVMATLPQKERRQMDGGEGWLDAVRGGFLSLNAALRKMEDIFDRLDAKSPNGVFNRVIMRPLVEAQAAERELLDTKIAEVVAAMKDVPKESLKRWHDKRTIDELAAMDEQGRPLPEPATMLGEELIAMALNMGNRGNMEKLIAGRGWDKQHGSMDAARAVVLEVLNRELTPADWQYVQRVWDIVDSLWPELSAMEKRVNGFAPDKVEAESFWVGSGIDAVKLRGGYFPVVYDPRSNVGARNLEVEENGLFPSSYYRATTRAGSTRERTEFKGPLHLSLGVLNRHLAEVVHDITHREAIINADKFLSDPRVKQGVIDVVGTEIEKQFRPWLQHIANEWAADREANSQAERMMKGLRTNATMVGLGFRISTIMLQVSGYAGSIERVGLLPIVRGIIKSRWSPEAWGFALDNSKELRSRMATMDRDIRDNARRLASKQAGIIDAAQQFAFHGIGYMDRLVTVATWHGAYDKALGEGQTHDDAVFFADKMVRQSQGSGAAKDMARVQRGTGKMGEAWKLASMFYSYSSAFYQRQAAFANDTANAVRERDLAAVPDLAARFLWLNIVPALAAAFLSGNGPGDDEDEAAWALGKILTSQFQGIPIARGIAGAMDTGFGYSFTPAEGFGRSVVNLMRDVVTTIEGEETKRMTRNFLETIGYATGKVPGQLATSTQFLVDVGYGEQDPQTAAEWWRGITKGKAVAEK